MRNNDFGRVIGSQLFAELVLLELNAELKLALVELNLNPLVRNHVALLVEFGDKERNVVEQRVVGSTLFG